MCKNFVAFGLILRLKLLPKPSGFGPIDCRVNQTPHEIYIIKSPNGVPVAAQRLVHKLCTSVLGLIISSFNYHPLSLSPVDDTSHVRFYNAILHDPSCMCLTLLCTRSYIGLHRTALYSTWSWLPWHDGVHR